MTPHKQLFLHRPDEGVFGDCYRTCIASLLDVEPDAVPHEHRLFEDGEQRKMLDEFLKPRGLATMFMAFDCDPEALMQVMRVANPGMYYLLSGTSRTGCNHVVICKDDEIVHDPSLTDSGIIGRCDDGHSYIEWLVPRLLMATSGTTQVSQPPSRDVATDPASSGEQG